MAPRFAFFLVAVLAAVSAVAAWRPLFPIVQPTEDSMLGVEDKFNSFLTQYGKNYTGRQYLHRLKVFRDNLVKATLNQVCCSTVASSSAASSLMGNHFVESLF
jgi:hypothetical protein